MKKHHPEEFIGKELKILRAVNPSQQGIFGLIIDETKSTFCVRTAKGDKTVLKANNTFLIDGKEIDGDNIARRPEERIKR